MDQDQDHRDDQEVEMLLGAIPSVWRSTQNLLRDVGYDQQPEQSTSTDQDKAARLARSPTPGPARDAQGNERVCRLCFTEEHELTDDGSSLGRLISPCRCDGSMKYVHIECLSQWRLKSKASEAARICGQCHARYRFRQDKWSGVAVFLQASQPLRLIAAWVCVSLCVVASGILGTAGLYTVKRMENTSLDFIRNGALSALEPPQRPWNITLADHDASIQVTVQSTLAEMQGAYGSSKEVVVRASFDALDKIRLEKSGDPIWFEENSLSDSLSSSDSDSADEDVVDWLLGIKDEGAPRPGPRLQPKKDNSTLAGKAPFKHFASLAAAMTNRMHNLWSNTSSDLPRDTDSPGKADSRRDFSITYVFSERQEATVKPEGHFLYRIMPAWTGPFRFIPLAVYVLFTERIHSMVHFAPYLWVVVTRCALLLSILVCESWREVAWAIAKSATAAGIAYLDEHYQAAPPLPPNAILLGPPRSRQRVLTGKLREMLSFASIAVFGPYWLNWWGGYPLSVYMGPRSFSSTERVELMQLAPVFAPSLTLLVDFAFVGLSSVSSRAERFRESHTRWWKWADWVYHDSSAAEGYRRFLSVLLGDEEQAIPSRYDFFLERENGRVLPGRVRPLTMTTLPQESYWRTVIMVGCIITVFVAFVFAVDIAWESALSPLARQIGRSFKTLWYLLISSAPDLRLWKRRWQYSRDWVIAQWRSLWSYEQQPAAPPDNAEPVNHASGPYLSVPVMLATTLTELTSLYGCFHAFSLVMRIITTYLPMIPFAVAYASLEDQIRYDLAQKEVLDRDEPLE